MLADILVNLANVVVVYFDGCQQGRTKLAWKFARQGIVIENNVPDALELVPLRRHGSCEVVVVQVELLQVGKGAFALKPIPWDCTKKQVISEVQRMKIGPLHPNIWDDFRELIVMQAEPL